MGDRGELPKKKSGMKNARDERLVYLLNQPGVVNILLYLFDNKEANNNMFRQPPFNMKFKFTFRLFDGLFECGIVRHAGKPSRPLISLTDKGIQLAKKLANAVAVDGGDGGDEGDGVAQLNIESGSSTEPISKITEDSEQVPEMKDNDSISEMKDTELNPAPPSQDGSTEKPRKPRNIPPLVRFFNDENAIAMVLLLLENRDGLAKQEFGGELQYVSPMLNKLFEQGIIRHAGYPSSPKVTLTEKGVKVAKEWKKAARS